jgi:hypothetical protein
MKPDRTAAIIRALHSLAKDSDAIALHKNAVLEIADVLEKLHKAFEQKTAESMALALHPLYYLSGETGEVRIVPLYPQPELVDENTPKDRPLLMYWPNHYDWQSGRWLDDAWYPAAGEPALCSTNVQPTHWMEMPPKPKGEGND